jgi:hypothetical protein
MMDTKLIPAKKDHYLLMIKGQSLGMFERSELRHLIQIIDNGI